MGDDASDSALLCLRDGSNLPDIEKWLKDEVVNAYLKLVAESSRNSFAQDVLFLNSFFLGKLVELGPGDGQIARWVQKAMRTQDKNEFRRVVLPVHINANHWLVLAADFQQKVVYSIDSLDSNPGTRLTERMALVGWAKYWTVNFPPPGLVSSSRNHWTDEYLPVPQQQNRFDCGVFACANMALWSHKKRLEFSQTDAGPFRLRIAYAISENQLVGCRDDEPGPTER